MDKNTTLLFEAMAEAFNTKTEPKPDAVMQAIADLAKTLEEDDVRKAFDLTMENPRLKIEVGPGHDYMAIATKMFERALAKIITKQLLADRSDS